MQESEFDKFAEEYHALHSANIRMSGESPEYFSEYKIRDVADAWRHVCDLRKDNLTILDFGSGIGGSIAHFREFFPSSRLVCLDVSQRCLDLAGSRFPNMANFVQFDGRIIPFEDMSFDIAFAACVFHHIDESEHSPLLGELNRVLKPRGRLFVFEHNPLNPITVHAVNTCPFDENAKLIRGGTMKERFLHACFSDVYLRYRLFFPGPIARLRPLERYMGAVPFGAQYYVVGSKG
jgi:ubiquinone/menaquinone biosynthesis C-methylase UbiE